MKSLTDTLQESLDINEAHDSFFLTQKISQYLCEVRGIDEVEEILNDVAKGLEYALKKREKQLSSEKETNKYIENVMDGWLKVLKDNKIND